MKWLFFVSCVLFCGAFLRAEENSAAEIDLIPDHAKDMIGEWQGFVLNHDEPTMMTSDRYCFLDSGKWEILTDKVGAEAEVRPQGWYKVSEKQLYLQPKELAEKNENAAIPAELRDGDRFVIQNPLDDKLTLLFIRADSLIIPNVGGVEGKWKIMQKDPESGETHTAPYCLVLKKDGTYTVDQPGKELPAEWSKGSYTISGFRVQLKNEFTGEGLWQAPAFFLLDGKLRYNKSPYCVWCEKIQDTEPEKSKTGKPAEKNAGKTDKPSTP